MCCARPHRGRWAAAHHADLVRAFPGVALAPPQPWGPWLCSADPRGGVQSPRSRLRRCAPHGDPARLHVPATPPVTRTAAPGHNLRSHTRPPSGAQHPQVTAPPSCAQHPQPHPRGRAPAGLKAPRVGWGTCAWPWGGAGGCACADLLSHGPRCAWAGDWAGAAGRIFGAAPPGRLSPPVPAAPCGHSGPRPGDTVVKTPPEAAEPVRGSGVPEPERGQRS